MAADATIPAGPPLEELPAYRSIADVPFLQARAGGARVALRFSGGALSYADLDDRARRFAAHAGASGAGPGERVAILLPNRPEFAVAYFGAIAAGAVAVPVNTRLSPPEVGHVLSDSGAAMVVTTRAHRERLAGLRAARDVASWVLVDGSGPGAVEWAAALDRAPRGAPAAVDPGDVACLLYTSGTTGLPKGAMISHANALFNVGSCRRTLGYHASDVGLASIPLFHVTGLHSQLLALLACGGTVVLQEEYDTRGLLELAVAHRVTALFLVPAIYRLLTLRADPASHDLSHVRIAAYGGAPMDTETIGALERMLPGARLHNCYGLTECSSLGTVLPHARARSHAGSVGQAVPGTEAQVRDPDRPDRVLPAGEPGELWLRGPHVVQGYWRAPEKTAAAIVGGWLRTGDLARIDADGLVWLLDRLKDMINRGGEKVYGLEVENVLCGHPAVAEAAVVGVPHPIFGEVPAAFVVAAAGAKLDPEAVRAHCAARLAEYKVPVAVVTLDVLPRNPGGKVRKSELRKAWNPGQETRR